MVLPQFTVAPYIVARTDFIVTLPRGVANAFAQTFELRLSEPPLDLPSLTISMFWHERTHHSVAHRWLRWLIAEVGVNLSSQRGTKSSPKAWKLPGSCSYCASAAATRCRVFIGVRRSARKQ